MPYGATPSRWCVCQFHHFRALQLPANQNLSNIRRKASYCPKRTVILMLSRSRNLSQREGVSEPYFLRPARGATFIAVNLCPSPGRRTAANKDSHRSFAPRKTSLPSFTILESRPPAHGGIEWMGNKAEKSYDG